MFKISEKFEVGIEEAILVFLILIELLDFFTVIPPGLEFCEKVLAMFAICFLFYRASITKIVFGFREWTYDVFIVLGYFFLSVKTIVGFAFSAVGETSMFTNAYYLLAHNAILVEKMGFWLGAGMLILLSVMLIHERVKKPCVMQIIHEEDIARGWKKVTRFFSTYIVLVSIYLLVFTFFIEWLAITVDAPILVIVLFFYLFVVVKRGRHVRAETFLQKVSETSEEYYSKFISLLHARRTVPIAIMGLLALHLLVEIGHYLIPYCTGLMYTWYFEQLGPGHTPITELIIYDLSAAGGLLNQIGVFIVYILNVFAVVMLFLGPAYIWLITFRKWEKIRNIAWIFLGSLSVLILMPVFRMKTVDASSLVGVDIVTQNIQHIENVWWVILVGVLVGGLFYLLGRINAKRTCEIGFFAVLIYLGIYLYHFFYDISLNYIQTIVVVLQNGLYFIGINLLMFFGILILFYVGGYFIFVYYVMKKIKKIIS